MRSIVLLLVGLAVGALCTVIAINALDRGTSHRDAAMTMMAEQMRAMGASLKANKCTATDLMPRLQTLRFVANDIEPAFAGEIDDPQFNRYAADLRAAADLALASPPASCQAASATVSNLKRSCDSCHREFKG